MLIVALTGGIGCGKTTVSDLFAQLGVNIIDTDIIARQLVEPGKIALRQIIQTFGKEILMDKGSLNRAALAQLCFTHPENRKKLEAILHPKINEEVKQQLEQLSSSYAIVVIPLLIESKPILEIDRILVVDCSAEQQQQRIRLRDQRSDTEINAIIQAQASQHQRLEAADDVIKNDHLPDGLKKQVLELHKHYLEISPQY